MLQSKHFLLFKEQNVFFASQKLLEDFELADIAEVKEKLLPKLSLEKLLKKETLIEEALSNDKGQKFYSRSIDINKNKEKVVFLDPFVGCASVQKTQVVSDDKLAFVNSRVSFIELLKEKIIEANVSKGSSILLTLNIENIDKLHLDFKEMEIEEGIRDLLLQIDILLGDKLAFAQYDKDFYIALFEEDDFEAFKEKIHNYITKISAYIEKQKFKPLLGVFSFVIKDKELNATLVLLDKIVKRKITQEDIQTNQLEYSNTIKEDMAEPEVIRSLLEAAFINKTNIKLLNIYKGLCINTSARIIKYRDDTIYIQLEQLQGLVMRQEKETVLQSAGFFKDIRGSVKHVNLDKNIAILDEFKFLDTNANARKYSRVTFSAKSFVVLSYKNATLNGEILDISVTSIAIASKYAKLFDYIGDQKVALTFVLPNATNVDGHTKMRLDAQVVFSACDRDGNCKIVCEFIHDESAEALLMEYVYNRQKEIIIELKKMAKKKTLL